MSEQMGSKANKRLDSVRVLVQEMIISMVSILQRQEACVHLNGVSNFSSMLAKKRGQNQELAAIIGLLHDYYYYKTGIHEFPGPNSAETVRPLLRDMNIFTKEEQTTILKAIFHRGDRSRVHGPYEEIVKDAYVMQLYFQNSSRILSQQDVSRLRNVFRELAIPEDFSDEMHDSDKRGILQNTDRRSKLADIAEALGRENIIGVPGDERYREICNYWPDQGIYKVLQSNWCAAFVYHCCMQAGFQLPIRDPNGMYRLAGVGAWLDWAQLPETGFLCFDGQNGFTPQRGDIVIYEKLLTDVSHDHIGIVLACDDKEILVAEGNRDNQNYSSVFYRDRWRCILGYIRIDNDYRFHFSGDYNPII
ncbi:CHAP domain-containing protein [Paenibacillus uliginis N3/975]|uniref:CHAP domain-containing protein n=1 Tax=Paenibacillus uliginis N3/975 TaxID=1313296 RepID=A0A1X7HL94_9BACL|nr:CHAP domain-containing protein [Paenibacillus uliginis]SMF87869.1 CHAP domain-containing protein [Paenibacillus uliginis N3/975]